MARIVIAYRLSETGRRVALASGRNAGEEQVIILQSPDHKDPEPIALDPEIPKALAEAAKGAPKSEIGVFARELIQAVSVLAQALDPTVTRDTNVEVASPELWALASGFAALGANGFDSIGLGNDDSRGNTYSGYSVREDRGRGTLVIDNDRTTLAFDRPMTAAELIPAEKLRREALMASLAAARVEHTRRATELQIERAVEDLALARRRVEYDRARLTTHRDLPAVTALDALLATPDPTDLAALQSLASQLSSARETATTAMKVAEESLAKKTMSAWIREHGSEHLSRLADFSEEANTSSLREEVRKMYFEERLKAELRGWVKGGNSRYSSNDQNRPPTLDELDLHERAKRSLPNAKLEWFRDTKQYLPTGSFLGEEIHLDETTLLD